MEEEEWEEGLSILLSEYNNGEKERSDIILYVYKLLNEKNNETKT